MQHTERPEYTYDYHWGRIILAGVLLVCLGIASTFFMGSDNQTESPAPTLSDTTIVVQPPVATEALNTQTENEDTIVTKNEPQAPALTQVDSDPIPEPNTPPQGESAPKADPIEPKTAAPITPVIAKSEIKIERPTALSSDIRTQAELFTATIKRAKLTSKISKREPGANLPQDLAIDENGLSKVYFYTEVIGQAGKTHYHHWYHNGKLKAKVPITIGSDRWRCYSSKYLTHQQTGEWEVKVKNAKGELLAQSQFNFVDQ